MSFPLNVEWTSIDAQIGSVDCGTSIHCVSGTERSLIGTKEYSRGDGERISSKSSDCDASAAS